jgi:hypothetical protein
VSFFLHVGISRFAFVRPLRVYSAPPIFYYYEFKTAIS